jgi:hypothetical protein
MFKGKKYFLKTVHRIESSLDEQGEIRDAYYEDEDNSLFGNRKISKLF